MTGMLIVTAMVLLLILALRPAHRRAGSTWRPGLDTRPDRDRPRLLTDLAAAADRLADEVDRPVRRLPDRSGEGPELRTQPTWLPERRQPAA
ncbi:MAG: hypothetical protein AAGC63_07260 [Propionicimonas sp.]|nr:hypothetical protein [Propionicimonas sp.]